MNNNNKLKILNNSKNNGLKIKSINFNKIMLLSNNINSNNNKITIHIINNKLIKNRMFKMNKNNNKKNN